jgi:hypothetical protein
VFQPNSIGVIKRHKGYDKFGQSSFEPAAELPYAPVNLARIAMKTSVRADSSASRGMADEIATAHAKILVPAFISIRIPDRVELDGVPFRVLSTHPRKTVFGTLDHIECEIEALPE